jgi:peroxiredoxin
LDFLEIIEQDNKNLHSTHMALQIGSIAPVFTGKSKTDSGLIEINLEQNLKRKKIVLLFFPFAFTGGCTQEMCTLSADYAAYETVNAVVYGISVDSPFAQEAWAKQNKIHLTLISDFNKQIAQQYDVLYSDLMGLKGVAKRSAFVIDLEGKIAYTWVTEDPTKLPDFNAIKAALA